ncbi:hypothetical protein ACQ4M3_02400 [Leptolyngbya sp. AN03gr2]|uniref:hypothetical protein n=1 Tax=unclassified Leptolyngbya TaxID=2650499 RepID=UPI003D321AE5
MTQQNLIELAKKGNTEAIANLINRQLLPKGIIAKVNQKAGCLYILLESPKPLDKVELSEFVHRGVIGLNLKTITSIKICGRQKDSSLAPWIQEFDLTSNVLNVPSKTPEPAKNVSYQQPVSETRKTSPQKVDSKTNGKNRKMTVAILTSFLLVVMGAGAFFYFKQAEKLAAKNSDVGKPVIQSDPYENALQNSELAIYIAAISRTEEDLDIAISYFQKAVELMRQLPNSDQRHSSAQSEIAKYEKAISDTQKKKLAVNAAKAQREKVEETIDKLRTEIEDAKHEQELIDIESGSSMSEIMASRKKTASRRKELDAREKLLYQGRSRKDQILKTVKDEDLARLDYDIARQKKILAGQPSISVLSSPPELRQDVETILKSFLALNSRMKTGVDYRDYADQVQELKVLLDGLSSKAQSARFPTLMKLEAAFSRYEYALKEWSECISQDDMLCFDKDHSFFWASANSWLESVQKDLTTSKI